MPDIDRRAVLLDRQLDDADRAVDAGAEAARRGDQQVEGGLGAACHRCAASTRLLARGGSRFLWMRDRPVPAYRKGAASPVISPAFSPPRSPCALVLAGCARNGEIDRRSGGITAVRSACPAVGVPAGTGDITLFDPPTSRDATAIDVTAAMTNVRSTCDDAGDRVATDVTFDVLRAARPAPSGARRDAALFHHGGARRQRGGRQAGRPASRSISTPARRARSATAPATRQRRARRRDAARRGPRAA